jgi:hypothetical protein
MGKPTTIRIDSDLISAGAVAISVLHSWLVTCHGKSSIGWQRRLAEAMGQHTDRSFGSEHELKGIFPDGSMLQAVSYPDSELEMVLQLSWSETVKEPSK